MYLDLPTFLPYLSDGTSILDLDPCMMQTTDWTEAGTDQQTCHCTITETSECLGKLVSVKSFKQDMNSLNCWGKKQLYKS